MRHQKGQRTTLENVKLEVSTDVWKAKVKVFPKYGEKPKLDFTKNVKDHDKMIKIRISYTQDTDLMRVIEALKGFKVANTTQDAPKGDMKSIKLELE